MSVEVKSVQLVHLEKFLDKAGLADFLCCGTTFIEERMAEGMPRHRLAGRPKFLVSEVLPWLEEHGYKEREA